MIDPVLHTVYVHFFEDGSFPRPYAFTDSIPVNIYNGALKIELSEIERYL